MTKEQAQFISVLIEGTGLYECQIREDYSGRGMFGKTTYAVVTNCQLNQLFCFLTQLIAEEYDIEDEDKTPVPSFNNLYSDSMGMSSIVIY